MFGTDGKFADGRTHHTRNSRHARPARRQDASYKSGEKLSPLRVVIGKEYPPVRYMIETHALWRV